MRSLFLIVFCVLSFGGSPTRGVAQDISGTWRLSYSMGTSYWEITAKDDGKYVAQEYGLGNAKGTVHLKGKLMVIVWETKNLKGFYEFTIEKNVGSGEAFQTQFPADHKAAIVRVRDGQKVLAFGDAKIRFIGK